MAFQSNGEQDPPNKLERLAARWISPYSIFLEAPERGRCRRDEVISHTTFPLHEIGDGHGLALMLLGRMRCLTCSRGRKCWAPTHITHTHTRPHARMWSPAPQLLLSRVHVPECLRRYSTCVPLARDVGFSPLRSIAEKRGRGASHSPLARLRALRGQTRISVGIWGGPPRGRPLVDGLTSCSVVHRALLPWVTMLIKGTAARMFVQSWGCWQYNVEGREGGGRGSLPRSIVGWDWDQKVEYSFVGTYGAFESAAGINRTICGAGFNSEGEVPYFHI